MSTSTDRWINAVRLDEVARPGLVWGEQTGDIMEAPIIVHGQDPVTKRVLAYCWSSIAKTWEFGHFQPGGEVVLYDFKIDELPAGCVLPPGYEHLAVPDPDTAVLDGRFCSTVSATDPGAGFNIEGFVSPIDGRMCTLCVFASKAGIHYELNSVDRPETLGEDLQESYRDVFTRLLGKDHWARPDDEPSIRANTAEGGQA